ncbi:MAG: DUF3786 domain-containing protein, partial [Planctomycetota bacterium]
QDLPLANTLVKAEALPSGQFFFRGPHTLPTDKLEKAFGQCPENLHQIAEQLGAQKSEFGDASIQLCLLPRVPLTIVVWGRCFLTRPQQRICPWMHCTRLSILLWAK